MSSRLSHRSGDSADRGVDAPLSLPARLLVGLLMLIGALPLTLRRSVGRMLGRIFAALPTREREIARLQLRAFLPTVDPSSVVPRMFAGLGETIMEGFNLSPIVSRHEQTIRRCQPELFEWAIHQGRPILGLTAHTGNWELFAAYLNARGVNSVAIGRPARSALLHQALARLRENAGIRVLWRAGRGGMKDILAAFESKAIVGALIDQDTKVKSIAVPFFGAPAQTPVTLIEIAKQHNALIFSAFIVREPDGMYALHIKKLNEQGSSEEILTSYQTALEDVIRAHPEQWVWFHKRWRSLPSGERRSGGTYLEFLRGVVKNEQQK